MNLDKLKDFSIEALLSKQRELDKKRRLTREDQEVHQQISQVIELKKVEKDGEKMAKMAIEEKRQQELAELKNIWQQPLEDLCRKVKKAFPASQPAPTRLTINGYQDINRLTGQMGLKNVAENNNRLTWVRDQKDVWDYLGKTGTVCGLPQGNSDSKGVQLSTLQDIRSPQKVSYLEIHNVPMSPVCAGLELATSLIEAAQANGGFSLQLQSADVQSRNITMDENNLHAGVISEGAKLLSDGQTIEVAQQIKAELNIQNFESLQRIITDNEQWEKVIKRIMRPLTRLPALSRADQSMRGQIALYSLTALLTDMKGAKANMMLGFAETFEVKEDDTRWEAIQNLWKELGIEDAKAFSFLANGNGVFFLVNETALSSDSPLHDFAMNGYEETLDIAVALGKETDESANTTENRWLSGRLPTMEGVRLRKIAEEVIGELDKIPKRRENANLTSAEEQDLEKVLAIVHKTQWMERMPSVDAATSLPNFTIVLPNEWESRNKRTMRRHYTLDGALAAVMNTRNTDDPGPMEVHTAECTPAWRMRDFLTVLMNDRIDDISFTAWEEPIAIRDKMYPLQTKNEPHLNNEIFLHNPNDFVRAVHRAVRPVTREFPRSLLEACARISRVGTTTPPSPIGVLSAENTVASFKEFEQNLSHAGDVYMKMRPVGIELESDTSLQELLTILDEELLNESGLTFAKTNGHMHFVCPADKLPASLAEYRDTDAEEALDLVVNLGLEKEDDLDPVNRPWVSGTLPTIEELEKKFFETEIVTEKFLPNTKDADTSEEGEEQRLPSEDEPVPPEELPIPRLRAVRDTLLRLKMKAKFTLDERKTMPTKNLYGEAEPGHYVVVTIPDANLQLLVSDDRSKGTRVIYNQINPAHFATINAKELDEELGPTRLRFDTRENFMEKLSSTIHQRRENPYAVYPVNSRYPSPLDTFPNVKAIEAIRRDFETAALHVNKTSIADLTRSDIEKITATEGIIWSFGGAACGAAYLDRVASEFGMDASKFTSVEHKIEQYEYRDRIFRLLQWELNAEGYRDNRVKEYHTADRFDRKSNIQAPRKRRKSAKESM